MTAPDSSPIYDLEQLFAAEVNQIFGFLVHRAGNRAVAEDLTAQTFEAAHREYEAGRGNEVTPAWLRTVARRRLVDHWRRLGAEKRRHLKLIQQHQESVPPPDDPDSEIDDILATLPARQRAVLLLRYVDDLSVSEVADTMNLSYKATESLLGRARRSFATAYEANQPADFVGRRWRTP